MSSVVTGRCLPSVAALEQGSLLWQLHPDTSVASHARCFFLPDFSSAASGVRLCPRLMGTVPSSTSGRRGERKQRINSEVFIVPAWSWHLSLLCMYCGQAQLHDHNQLQGRVGIITQDTSRGKGRWAEEQQLCPCHGCP